MQITSLHSSRNGERIIRKEAVQGKGTLVTYVGKWKAFYLTDT